MNCSNDSQTSVSTKQTIKKGNTDMLPLKKLTPIPQNIFDEKAAQLTVECSRQEQSFSYAELSGIIIENRKLSGAEFRFSRLTGVCFSNSYLNGTEFKYAELENVEFRNCSLERSSFDFARFSNVRFVNCVLDRAEFDLTSGNVIFEHCSAGSIQYPMAELQCEFLHCNLADARFHGCRKLNLNAEKCNCCGAEFNDCVIAGTISDSILVETEFYGTDVSKVALENNVIRSIETRGAVGFSSQNDDEEDFDL